MDHPLGGAIAQYISVLMAEALCAIKCYSVFFPPLKSLTFLINLKSILRRAYNQMYRSGIHQGFKNSPQKIIILILVHFNKQYSVKIVNIFINIIKYSNLIKML